MTRYKLEMKDDGYKNKLEFESDDLSDVIANMEIFLKGCGFIFDGALDIHTGNVQKNAMHYIPRHESDKKFDDVITDSDQLDMEIKEDGNTTDTQK
jgi:hypothetical protein